MEGLCFKRLPAPKCIAARRLCRLWAVALAPAWAGRPRRQPHVQASQQARQGEMLQQYRQQQQRNERPIPQLQGATGERLLSVLALWALTELPAGAADALPGGPPASSYYVSLGLFVVTLPGLWSLIKRSPKAKIRRRTYEVPGPAEPDAMPLDQRAQQIFQYFKTYNYEVKSTGDVITFEGQHRASNSQAAALVLYTLVSLASTALVLSIAAPWGGNAWYLLCLLSPAAGVYYLQNATRTEEMKVKMITANDDSVTDIVMEGDEEELDRFAGELGIVEKGKIYVRGILQR